jgi:sensor c-di-GMP phosphodiesterase-like protein
MLCSSLGRHEGGGIDVGKADYTSSNGLVVRSARTLPYDDKSLYRISSSARSGFTAIVHTDNALDVVDEDSTEGAGLIGLANLKPISQSGPWKEAWAKRLGNQYAVTFFDGEYVVGLKRSTRYNYFTYAAIPEVRVQAEGRRLAELLIPIGVLAGLVLGFLVYVVTKQQLGIAAQLKNALLRDRELFLVYQPIVDLASGQWKGAEALLRWKRPDGEFVSPDVFIEIAEKNGLIGLITRKVIRTIQKDAALFLNAHPGFFISINASSSDLQQDALSQQLAHATRSMGIAPSAMRIEATERTFIDTQAARKGIARLREMGHPIAIDDFGTGYSSLSYLATMNVDGLKIDKSFVATIGTGAVTAEVVPHIIEMAKSLKLRMVAEGVETQEQADYLHARGVQMAQGWHYSRAISLHDLDKGLQAQKASLST